MGAIAFRYKLIAFLDTALRLKHSSQHNERNSHDDFVNGTSLQANELNLSPLIHI